jgi:hypothetical protein
MERAAPNRTAGGADGFRNSNRVRTDSVEAVVNAPAVRWTKSASIACSCWRKAGASNLRWAVLSLTPACRPVLSTVAPQAKAINSLWSAFRLPFCAIACPTTNDSS